MSALATLGTAVGVWIVTGLVLEPLRRLRTAAMGIRPGQVDQRLPTTRPQEVADLSATLNRMLDRLQSSMSATRRFTADAGHELRTPLTGLGMDLETLLRNPHLPAGQRHQMLMAMSAEHHRIVELLNGLQTLARGDAGVLAAQTTVDLVELVDDAVALARRRHSGIRYRLHADMEADVAVEGWSVGLYLAVGNLLDNAALHGRPQGTVDVSVVAGDAGARVTVADDGPGIPAPLRTPMTQRFTRGERPRSEGSGLGLALVVQQASLHGGTLVLTEAAGGGLSAALTLPVPGHSEDCAGATAVP